MLHRAAGSDVNHSRDGRVSQDLAPLPPGVRAGPGKAEGRRAGGPQSAEPSETRPAPRTSRQLINTTAEGSTTTEPQVNGLRRARRA
ncbi:hypothetical protein EAO76_13885 [Streptomyces sp. sk2.1]|nr:hypothetical protein EAO76_13885 [Streptomyces sp. sk2.1]